MPHHWLLLRLSGHANHPVSHSETVFLRTYFDEAPDDDSDLQKQGSQYVVATERSITVPNVSKSRLWLQITEAEYTAGSYDLYIWAEPYVIAAVGAPAVPEQMNAGRLKLNKSHEKRRGAASGAGQLHTSVATDDLVITHDIVLANSVVQFIVNEMNTNAGNATVQRTAEALKRTNAYVAEVERSNWFVRALTLQDAYQAQSSQNVAAAATLGHLTHKNSGWQGNLQDVIFLGGGEWDHKPIISPVWGNRNRLGNRHDVYYYDGWSNIHFGFIAARMGVSLDTAMMGAGKEQVLDNLGGGAQNTNATGDDDADTQAIAAGHRLGLRGGAVTRQDVLNILNAHPGWVGRG
jgi:Bacterial toxin 44